MLTVLVTIAIGTLLATPAIPATAAPTTPAARAVSPQDTGLLAFVRANQIYTSTTTGGSVTKLTTSGKNFRPHWSPDGKRIAYVHEAPAGHRDIWVMNADGSDKLQVTHLGDTTEPTWSPDGRWLAFGANGTPPYQEFQNDGRLQKIRSTAPFGSPVEMPGDGSGIFDPYVDGTLAWSPDGTRIVFASENYPSSPDHYLLVYTIATKEVDMIGAVGGSCCGEGYLRDPTWTNDSRTVALSYLVHDLEEPEPAGSHIGLIGFPDPTTATYPDVAGEGDPDFSPTGNQLVLSHWSRIWVSDADGTHRRDVTKGYYPDWQPVLG